MGRIAWQFRVGNKLIEEVDTFLQGVRVALRFLKNRTVRLDDGYVVRDDNEPTLEIIHVLYVNGILVEIAGRTLGEVIAEDYPDGDMTVEDLRRLWTA